MAFGYQLGLPVDAYKRMFSRDAGSAYQRMIKDIRNTKGFHFDEHHFREWINTIEAPYVTLWHKDSPSPLDWAFTASLQVQSFFGVQLQQELVWELKHATDLVFLVEALAGGIVLEAGYDPRACWRPVRYQQVRIEYEMHDARKPAPPPDRMIVAVDADGGGLSGTGQAVVLPHLYAKFGGKERTGYMLLADGAYMRFNSPSGSAVVWPEGPMMTEHPSQMRPLLLSQMRDPASWGEQQALYVLQHLEDLRSGTITPDQADVAIRKMVEGVEYWRRLQSAVEDAVRARRSGSSQSPESDG